MAYVIAVANQKGGVGKTMVSINISHGFNFMGLKTLLIDGDYQSSTFNWDLWGNSSLVHVVSIYDRNEKTINGNIQSYLSILSNNYDIVVIDCPAGIDKVTTDAISNANLVIIPVTPGPFERHAATKFIKIIKERKKVLADSGERLDAAFLINQYVKNSLFSREMRSAIEEHELPILNSKISRFMIYPQLANFGKTVFSKSKSVRKEFEDVLNEINKSFIKDVMY